MNSSPVVQTLADLVRINSVNAFYEGGPGEREIATWVRRFFEQRGIEVREQEVLTNRPNIIARLPGRDPARRLILEAHMDTASVTGMALPPFEGRIEDGRLYGRGACDTKGGLAAMMEAVAAVHESGHPPPCEVWLAATMDEEFSFRGVSKLCDGLVGHAALVAEPTSMRAIIAHKGALRWRILVTGKAAHSSKPHLGVNAINHMARVLLALEEHHMELAARSHPLVGPGTGNIGIIQGGVQVNFVPDYCAITIDRRLIPGENAEAVSAHYRQLLDRLQARHPGLEAIMEAPLMVSDPLETPADSPPAKLACALLAEMGLDGRPAGVPFGSDASRLSRQGVPSLVIGPGSIDQAHSAVEYVELAQVQQAFDFYRKFIQRFM